MVFKIAFFHATSCERQFFDEANALHHFEIGYFEERLNPKTCHLAKGFDAICIFVNDPVNAAMVDLLFNMGIKLIALRSAGYNHVDLRAAKDKIPIVRVPAYSPYSVAEYAVGLMLSLSRKIHFAYERINENNFDFSALMGFDMHGKIAGVIGTGRIGKAVINILKGFGMRVLAHDLYPEEVEKAECPFVDLDTLYRECDIITIHCNLTPDNFHMIDKNAIAKMKTGVMIINTARGGHINTPDLIEALKSGKVGFAGLDVYENEAPYFSKDFSKTGIDDPILTELKNLPNVLLTPHMAFFTKEALTGIAETTLENVSEFAQGKPLSNQISA